MRETGSSSRVLVILPNAFCVANKRGTRYCALLFLLLLLFLFFFGVVGSGFVAFDSSTKWVRRFFDGFGTCVMNLFVVGE